MLEESEVEQVWCHVTTGERDNLLIGCIYRSPLNCRTVEAKAKHEKIANPINPVISEADKAVDSGIFDGLCIAGDFNYPELVWSDQFVHNLGKDESAAGRFLDTIDSYLLHQPVRSPTFFRPNRPAKNVLDIIILEREERVDIISINAPLGKASQGHGLIEFSLNLSSTSPTPQYKSTLLNFNKGKYSETRSTGTRNLQTKM